MVAAFVLFLREGLEACLVVSILLAALRQLQQTRYIRAVWIGVIQRGHLFFHRRNGSLLHHPRLRRHHLPGDL